MGLVLNNVYDPRDALQKVRRKPLENYMREHFPAMFRPGMPADLMRMILRQNGVSRIDAVTKTIDATVPDKPAEAAIDALALLKQDWMPFNEDMKIGDLRKACKERGIRIDRRYRKTDMVRLLNGQNPIERHE